MKTRVLIVDECADNLEYIAEHISNENVEIQKAHSEEEALALARSQRFFLALSLSSDLEMLKKKVDVSLRLNRPALKLPHFREPLSSVIGFAELLQEGDLNPSEQQKATDVILKNAQILWHLIGGEISPPAVD